MGNNDRLNEGIRHQREGRLAEAEWVYQQILREEPENADALHMIGVLEGQRGNNDLAIERLRRAVELDPTLVPAWRNLGALLAVKGQFREKSAALEQLGPAAVPRARVWREGGNAMLADLALRVLAEHGDVQDIPPITLWPWASPKVGPLAPIRLDRKRRRPYWSAPR